MPRQTLPGNLWEFLNDTSNSLSRENLISQKLIFDVKLAAAQRCYFLNVYLPDVDQDGCDMILDDMDSVIQVQVKSKMSGGRVRNWEIHKRLLRPSLSHIESLGFEASPTGHGAGGGVVLIEISTDPSFSVRYFYTDILIMCGLRDHYINATNQPSENSIRNLFRQLQAGNSRSKVKVSRPFFLEARNPEALLGLMGLHNRISTACWRMNLLRLIDSNEDTDEFIALISHVNDELFMLSPRIIHAQD